MANSSEEEIIIDCNQNMRQKKRKINENRSTFETLSDPLIQTIVSSLFLTEKLVLRGVNRKLKTSIDQSLAKEECIQFVDSYGKDTDVWVNNRRRNRIDINKIGFNFNDDNHCLVEVLNKFRQIKRLEFNNNIRITNQMLEWLFKRFPKISSLSLVDYRCDYYTFNWMAIGDRLSKNLVSLEIECRRNHQIYSTVLAHLLTKLDRLQELTIVSPRRSLEDVFRALGPNLVKLRITYCEALYDDEVLALIDGNGKQLKQLDIDFQSMGKRVDENLVFELICKNLLNLRSFSFNHWTLSPQSMAMIAELKNLKTFSWNPSGLHEGGRFTPPLYFYNELKFSSMGVESFNSLQTLKLSYVQLKPQFFFAWDQLFPNLKHLYLKGVFVCGCGSRIAYRCFCAKLCYQYLSEVKTLRSIVLDESIDLCHSLHFHHMRQIQFFEVNCFQIKNRNYLNAILNNLVKMATQQPIRPLFVRLYDIRCGPLSGLIVGLKFPENLKITFSYN